MKNTCPGCQREFVDTEQWPEGALCLDCELDDDGDDDEPADGESFDGGFGPGSYFSRAMQKDD